MQPTLLVAALTIVFPTSATTPPTAAPMPPLAQLGGGGFGGNPQAGFGQSFGVPIQSGEVIVVAPESKDSLAAFSSHHAVWKRIPIKPKEEDSVIPIVGSNVAAVRVGQMVYAFGAEAGKWHWVETETKMPPVIGSGRVTVQDGDWYYVLSSKSGRWSGLNLKTGEIR